MAEFCLAKPEETGIMRGPGVSARDLDGAAWDPLMFPDNGMTIAAAIITKATRVKTSFDLNNLFMNVLLQITRIHTTITTKTLEKGSPKQKS